MGGGKTNAYMKQLEYLGVEGRALKVYLKKKYCKKLRAELIWPSTRNSDWLLCVR